MHICMTYLDEGTLVLVPNPGYPTYRSAARLAGGHLIDYELKEENHWMPDFDAIAKQLSDAGASGKKDILMFVNYPHMPTGQLPSKALFEQLVAFAKAHHILLVHDNPYSFILNDQPMSLMSEEGAKDVAVDLNSLSKSQTMAGWRVGMMVGAKSRIDEVLRFKSNMDSGMFLPVQLAAAKALALPGSWYESINAVYRRRREKVFELLRLLHCPFDDSQAGMFVWAKIPPDYKDGFALSDDILYNANVFIKHLAAFSVLQEINISEQAFVAKKTSYRRAFYELSN